MQINGKNYELGLNRRGVGGGGGGERLRLRHTLLMRAQLFSTLSCEISSKIGSFSLKSSRAFNVNF